MPSSSIDEVEDAEEDAVRLAYEGPTVDIALALPGSSAPNRSTVSSCTPSRTRSCAPGRPRGTEAPHALDLLLLHQDDQSPPSVRKPTRAA